MRSGKKHALCFTQHIPNQYVFQNICILSVKNVEEGNGMREKKNHNQKNKPIWKDSKAGTV